MVWIIDPISGRKARRGSSYTDRSPCQDEDIERLVARGRKLAAIKLYRERYRADLRTAKLAVDAVAERLVGARP